MEPHEREQDDRTGKYGGDDGALEHEQVDSAPGEDAGTIGTPTGATPASEKTQAERKQDRDLDSGEENPG